MHRGGKRMRWMAQAVAAAALALTASACQPTAQSGLSAQQAALVLRPSSEGDSRLSAPFYDPDVDAVCTPPVGWKPDPLKKSNNHAHQVWLSANGRTAFGVIHFSMPFPVGEDLALWGFIKQMQQTEGDAHLLSRQDDPNLPGIRFVAEGGQYKIFANLIVRGFSGWAVYAGTLRNQPVDPADLDLAEVAREHTRVGNSSPTGK